jgi:alpha-L-fucosidase 2
MGSFHDAHNLFNCDISGGFPYLCASSLVYADPGSIRFFPARPPHWTKGSLKGIRLRGQITLKELSWNGNQAKAVLLSDVDQKVTIEVNGKKETSVSLAAGIAKEITL